MRPSPSTTTTASERASRMALENWSFTSVRRSVRTAMSGSLPLDGRQEERREQRPHLASIGLAVHGGAEVGRGRQALRVPAEMLARHAHAGLAAVVLEH